MLLHPKPAIEAGEAETALTWPASQVSSHRERDDAYRYVAVTLTERWRIASCHEGRQWIAQYRSTKDQWRTKKFFARASHAADWVRKNLEPDAYEIARQWAERHPHT